YRSSAWSSRALSTGDGLPLYCAAPITRIPSASRSCGHAPPSSTSSSAVTHSTPTAMSSRPSARSARMSERLRQAVVQRGGSDVLDQERVGRLGAERETILDFLEHFGVYRLLRVARPRVGILCGVVPPRSGGRERRQHLRLAVLRTLGRCLDQQLR